MAIVPPGVRVYAIGDIHGCSALLDRLHDKIENDLESSEASHTLLIYLGDYLDRGPDTCGVLDRLTLPRHDAATRIFLRGNHEEMALRFLQDPEGGASWCAFGGFETLMSYGIDISGGMGSGYASLSEAFAARLPSSHLEFFASLDDSYSIGDYFFCHAGVRPGVALEAQPSHDLLWIREEFLNSTVDHGKLVIHGHTPVDEPDVKFNRIDIDTGAYATGRLTAIVLEGAERRFLST